MSEKEILTKKIKELSGILMKTEEGSEEEQKVFNLLIKNANTLIEVEDKDRIRKKNASR